MIRPVVIQNSLYGMRSDSARSHDLIILSLASIILFGLQPLQTLLIMFVLMLMKGYRLEYVKLFSLFLFSYLSLINTTKIPESDLLNYVEWFNVAKNEGFFEYIAINSRAPLYFVYVYLVASMPFTEPQLFIYISTLLTYGLLVSSVIRVAECVGLSRNTLTGLILVIALFPPLFAISAHLMRQFLACALVVYYYSTYINTGRRLWWILIAATLVHYSAFLFLFFALAFDLRVIRPWVSVFIYLSILPILYWLTIMFSDIFLNIPLIGFVVSRMADTSSIEGDAHHVFSNLFVFMVFQMSFVVMGSKFLADSQLLRIRKPIWSLGFSAIAIGTLVVASSFVDFLWEISLRYFFYLYFFIFLIAPIYMINSKLVGKYLWFFVTFLLILFPYRLFFGEWIYADVWVLLFYPFWGF